MNTRALTTQPLPESRPPASTSTRMLLSELKQLARGIFVPEEHLPADQHHEQIDRFVTHASDILQKQLPLLLQWASDDNGQLERHISDHVTALRTVFDPLTGLHNRKSLLQHLQWRIESTKKDVRRFALLYIDIDGFKRINDSLGHTTADALLVELARRLEQTVEDVPDSLVARLGGDEFIILMGDVEAEEDAVTYARALEFLLRKPFKCAKQDVFLTASIGVAFGGVDAYTESEQMLEDADLAMYRAKHAGKAQCAVFLPSMRDEACARLQLEVDLREALSETQFEVFYQPKVYLGTGQVKGFEALIRWRHPRRGMVPPQEFISAAEEIGIISEIGRWVLQQAISQLSEWRENGTVSSDSTVAVNVSPRQFHEPDLLEWIKRELRKAALPPHCLVLEVTESVLMQDSCGAVTTLQEVVAEGIGLDLDDFGTGYSSLSYLHRFPFRSIKIDRSFVKQMSTEPQSINLVTSIVGLARSLKMAVIAEGVETEWQAGQLQKMGCAVAQGYLYSAPRPASELDILLVEQCGLLGPKHGDNLMIFPRTAKTRSSVTRSAKHHRHLG